RLDPTSSDLTPRPNPHRARGIEGAPSSRDFVPWRFSDAGRPSASKLALAGVRKPAHQPTLVDIPVKGGCTACWCGPAKTPRNHSQASFIATPALSTTPTQNMKP